MAEGRNENRSPRALCEEGRCGGDVPMPGQVASVKAIPDRYEVEEPSMSESSREAVFGGVVSMGCVWMCASSW